MSRMSYSDDERADQDRAVLYARITIDEALLRQALEALLLSVRLHPDAFGAVRSTAIAALRERLEKP